MSDPIIEVIELALAVEDTSGLSRPPEYYRDLSCRLVTAVAPLIRVAALEEAAKVAEDDVLTLVNKHKIAAAIRTLKEQSP